MNARQFISGSGAVGRSSRSVLTWGCRSVEPREIAGVVGGVIQRCQSQTMAAVIGGIASLIASPQAWPLLLCTLLAVGAMLCVMLAPKGRSV
ncbi:hypothetical protein PS838_01845 [Pseudomonas fluorescens]|nr:hypothetical protein PS838_01845 [Pseudomonas fluorescens]